ncbi:MAG: protein-L-isoaspartate(D-aspartate) O-methyltransferase [Helicobacter sp.]|nr:protein-L-isoaspartate(D-aspartate) O-methyltransferase [Helicobacter sp.]MDE7196966.1 protein-L-isoaspartate(D-aspartate) O-methyltransferase [Helicobacter sp.]
MVFEIQSRFAISDALQDAFMRVDREMFVDDKGMQNVAYTLDALPIAGNQWISSPLTVAKMTHHLQAEGADNVLEIGCGSGYQAAILSHIARRVFTIERIETLLLKARARIEALKIRNINLRLDDGQNGWKQFAPYDRILFSAAIAQIPNPIIEQLADGGILIAPLIRGNQQIITRFEKQRGIFKETQQIEECAFVFVQDGIVRC